MADEAPSVFHNCVRYLVALETLSEAHRDFNWATYAAVVEEQEYPADPWKDHSLKYVFLDIREKIYTGKLGEALNLAKVFIEFDRTECWANLFTGWIYYHLWCSQFVPTSPAVNEFRLDRESDFWLPITLLPLVRPAFGANFEDVLPLDTNHEYYKGAVEHLKVAVYKTPPPEVAMFSYVQMMILSDQIAEAFHAVEHSLSFLQPKPLLLLRLKSILLKYLDAENYERISGSLEELLAEYPTCNFALTLLVNMYQDEHYDKINLAEVIAKCLDETFVSFHLWRVFAKCLYDIRCEQIRNPRVSALFDSSRYAAWIPKYFTLNNAEFEIESGKVSLLPQKAAIAVHLFGAGHEYVLRAMDYFRSSENDGAIHFLTQPEYVCCSARMNEN